MGDPEITAKYGQYEYSVVIYSEEDAARVREFCQDHNVAWAPLSQYPPDQERFSEEEDFVIKDGVLVEYKGDAPTVVIPGGVTAIGDSVFKATFMTIFAAIGEPEINRSLRFREL